MKFAIVSCSGLGKACLFKATAQMERVGVRLNLGVWVVPERGLGALPVAEWIEAGAEVEVLSLHPRESEAVERRVRAKLQAVIGGAMEALVEGDALLAKDLVRTARGQHAEWKAARDRAYRVVRRAREVAEAAASVAESFEQAAVLLTDLGALQDSIRKYSQAYQARFDESRARVFGPRAVGGAA